MSKRCFAQTQQDSLFTGGDARYAQSLNPFDASSFSASSSPLATFAEQNIPLFTTPALFLEDLEDNADQRSLYNPSPLSSLNSSLSSIAESSVSIIEGTTVLTKDKVSAVSFQYLTGDSAPVDMHTLQSMIPPMSTQFDSPPYTSHSTPPPRELKEVQVKPKTSLSRANKKGSRVNSVTNASIKKQGKPLGKQLTARQLKKLKDNLHLLSTNDLESLSQTEQYKLILQLLNRAAAKKTRQEKKKYVQSLEERASELEKKIGQNLQTIKHLKNEIESRKKNNHS